MCIINVQSYQVQVEAYYGWNEGEYWFNFSLEAILLKLNSNCISFQLVSPRDLCLQEARA